MLEFNNYEEIKKDFLKESEKKQKLAGLSKKHLKRKYVGDGSLIKIVGEDND